MKLMAFQTCSMFPYTKMTFKILPQDGTELYRRQVSLSATSEIPQQNVHDGLYKMKLQGSEKLQTVSAEAMKD